MRIQDHTVQFFMGAGTMGEGKGKWSAPGRDLPFLYRRQWAPGRSCSIEPSIADWRAWGCMVAFVEGQGMRLMKVDDFAKHFGEGKLIALLAASPGVYLKESKDEILDTLGCPR
ncbi:hypothetical protein D3C73_205180 [compost metagenome]|jgi:hypothetical protein